MVAIRSVGNRSWRLRPDSDLRWRRWDDQYVVFHPASGDTHLLNGVTAGMLRRLEQGPADADDLKQMVNPGSAEEAAELSARIEKLLAWFDDLGLIEIADDPQRDS